MLYWEWLDFQFLFFINLLIGFFYIKHRGDGSRADKFAERFIPTINEKDEKADTAHNSIRDKTDEA